MLKYIFLLFLPSTVFSQITHRDLLQKNCSISRLKEVLISHSNFHPFPQTPEEWKKNLPDSIVNYLMSNGENALKENFPNIPASVVLDFVRNGNRTRYESLSFNKRNLLWNLVLAESIEGKKRFMNAIVDDIWSICEESFWGATAHLFLQKAGKGLPDVEEPVVDLFAAETAANLALADYFVGPQLDSISPLIRKRIYYEVNRRVFAPLQTAKYGWMGKGDRNAKLNNWAPWIMSNYLTAVLFLEKDSKKRSQYVFKAMQITDQYINGIGDDGATEEGPHYWSFGAGCVFDVLNLLSVATNNHVNIYNDELIRKMGDYIYATHIAGDYFINVADSHPEEFPEPILVYRYGKEIGDSSLAGFGTWLFKRQSYTSIISTMFHRARNLFDLATFKTISSANLNFRDLYYHFLPDAQLFAARVEHGFFLATHGGNNGESHNHNDVGDFIVYYKGDPVIVDVGSGTYTARTFSSDRYKLWFNTSSYHNLPTINGEQQQAGLKYAATRFLFDMQEENGPKIIINFEKAYPSSLGLSSWKRQILVDWGSVERIFIIDNFRANNPITSLTQTFMTVCATDISQPGKIIFTTAHGHKVELTYGKEWEVTKEVIPLVTEEDQGLKSTWHDQPITRILLKWKPSGVSARFEYNITAGTKN